jgi:hypothetical protein
MATARPTKEAKPIPGWLSALELVFTLGWIPYGYRTQLLAVTVAILTVGFTGYDWFQGELTLFNLWEVVQEHWGYYAGALGLSFLGDKTDRT